MNPANFLPTGGGMPSGAPAYGPTPSVDNQVMMKYVAQALQAQRAYTGWRADVPLKDRVVRVYQLFTSLLFIQPRADHQNLAQAALSFEQKAFKEAQQRVDYDKEVNDKLIHIRDTRARQAAAIANGRMPQAGPNMTGNAPEWPVLMDNAAFQGHRRAPSEVPEVSSAPYLSQQLQEQAQNPLQAPVPSQAAQEAQMGIPQAGQASTHLQQQPNPAMQQQQRPPVSRSYRSIAPRPPPQMQGFPSSGAPATGQQPMQARPHIPPAVQEQQPKDQPTKEGVGAQGIMNNHYDHTTNKNKTSPAAAPEGSTSKAPPEAKLPLTVNQLAAMTPQQRAQVEAHMRRERFQPRSRAAAEEAWNSLPEKILQAYQSLLQQTPPENPIPIYPKEKVRIDQQLRDFTNMLGRMDVLVQWFARIPNQEKTVRSLLGMRIHLMRQFKPTANWALNVHLTASPEYITVAINYIKKLFHAMNTRATQHQQQTKKLATPDDVPKDLPHDDQQNVRPYPDQLDVETAGEAEASERPWTPDLSSPDSADTPVPTAIDHSGPLQTNRRTFADTTALTDSGYGSLTHRKAAFRTSENSVTVEHVEHGNEASMQIEQPRSPWYMDTGPDGQHVSEADDTGSLYSETSSLGLSVVDGYVATLAEEVSRIISPKEPTEEVIQQIYETLPQMLRALSLSIGTQESSRMHREVMVFIHKYRRKIAESVRDLLSDEIAQSRRQDGPDGMSLDEKMSKWLGASEESGTTVVPELPDTQLSDEESEADSDEELLPEIAAYKNMIQSSPSYAKLIADLCREVGLAPSSPNIRSSVHTEVLQMLPGSHRISRQRPPQAFCMTFTVDWNPLVYVQEQEYTDAPDIAIQNAIVITGSASTAQAMTCAEYLQQTWPSIGISLLELIQNVIRSPHLPAISNGTPQMTAWLAPQTCNAVSYLSVDVTGHASWIAEIAEILAWIGSALRSSTNPGEIMCNSPLIRQLPPTDQSYKCMISYTADCEQRDPTAADGRCWHNLFREPVIAKGYPITRRPAERHGLELSLNMMSVLTETPRLNPFGGSYYIKGYSTMLVPTQYNESIMTWHLLYDENGKRIPYFDGWNLCHLEVDLSSLQAARHVLGWCSEINLYAGLYSTHDTLYNVQNSLLPEVDSNSYLSNISISMGQMIANGPSYCLGKKDIPVHVTRNGYARKLKWISKKFVLLWDEEDRRGWLINGTSALLHLVKTSLERDNTSDYSSLMIFDTSKLQYPPHPHRPGAAAWTLSNKANRALQIYDDDPPIYFQEYVIGFYDMLEKIMDHEAHNIESTDPSRSQLEGWDFDDLASERESIYPRVTQLDPVGTSWTNLIRSINGITLFGRKFGDIMKPANECPRWSSLPCGESYLAVSRADLEEIMTARRGNLFSPPFRLTDSVMWYIPEGLSDTCSCRDGQGGQHSDIVQILLPSSMAERLPQKGLAPRFGDAGAVIFGNSSKYPWPWADGVESPISRINRNLSRETKGSPSYDSGIGRSMSSASFLGRESGTTTGSSRSVTKECPGVLPRTMHTRPSSPIQLYRNADEYNVGIICALDNEWRAVRTLFDNTHAGASIPSYDPNAYAFGSMGKHNIVATCLPLGEIGTSPAARVAVNMKRSFPRLTFCLIVGIAGGVPVHHDIRLGDVVVSTPRGASVGVLPYDVIKNLDEGITKINGHLHPPPHSLRAALSEIQADPRLDKTPLAVYTRHIAGSDEGFRHPGEKNDTLYTSDYPHPPGNASCSGCDVTKVKVRARRDSTQPRVHYGLVASGNQVVKNALTRDRLGREHGILCFEMEAAGIMNILPSLVIRGICDYCDSHKNKNWQRYAAATAAAFAKLLLSRVRPEVEAGRYDSPSALKPHEMGYYGKEAPVGESVMPLPGAKRRRVFE